MFTGKEVKKTIDLHKCYIDDKENYVIETLGTPNQLVLKFTKIAKGEEKDN